jgi:HPt (histidine-containing phosphotransfer) domain-containing protein
LLLSTIATVIARHVRQTPRPIVSANAAAATETGVAGVEREAVVLDMDKLDELEALLTRTKLDGFISLYLTDLELHLARISECEARRDVEGILREAHAIVSTAGNLGAMQTSAVARLLEQACRRQENERLHSIIDALIRSSDAASAAFKLWARTRSANKPPSRAVDA